MSELDEITGTGSRRRMPLPLAIDQDPEAEGAAITPNYAANAPDSWASDLDTGRLAHRITDDNQTGNRSGGPAGNYQDPGAGRLSDLMTQRKALDAPDPKTSLWSKIAQVALPLAPVIAAYATGARGATEGAAHGYEEGVQRRQQQQDLAGKRRQDDKVRLSQEIEAEARAGQQRQFTHGEDLIRQRTAEEGMNARERMNQERLGAQDKRLAETIAATGQRQQAGFTQQDELEDRKQEGRMEVQRAKADAQMAVHKYQAAHPNANLPPVLTKAFGTYQQSQSRMDVMDASYKDAIRDPGNQQAMLNLLASHLGMTMGLQPGARMNQAIIGEAQRSGYLDERIEAHFGPDGFMTGVVLTPRQMSQMMTLAQSRLMEDARAVKATEEYLGRSGNAPITPRVPGQGTAAGPGAAGGGGSGGAGATTATTPADIPKPPRAPDPGMKWQYNVKTKQFREIPIVAK